ncbi:MAG: filamentous hemagglutinin N-terminal domain-containing protein [Dendronalium sp. ChiSLP03b]
MAFTPMKITKKLSILQALSGFWSVPNIQLEKMFRCDLSDRSNMFKFWQTLITLATTSGVIFSGNSVIAQIVPDGTLGTEGSVVTPNIDIKGTPSDRIDGGAVRGTNLFHSFQEFNIGKGRGAYFNNPTGVDNIFSRVTGSNASNIYGKLGVLGNANLFLLNPNGILFGPDASLDLTGSFLGSTANSFNFGNGIEFSATNPTSAPLLSVSVPLGVQFNQQQPSPIVNSGNLEVSTGQNLNLLGGTVASTGNLLAPGGQITVAAVPGGSVVNLTATGQLQNIDTSLPVEAGNSAALAEFLTSSNAQFHPGLFVNSNGQVELSGSGLSVGDGDVVAKNVTAQTATLTAYDNLTLIESLIGTNGDLNLLAGDTVRVRDSVTKGFVTQAGGNLTIQGNKGIDILALNHSQTPFVSAGNLSLVSDGIISGDAHFFSGGSFSILNLAGGGGNFVSLYDPIIRSNEDVTIGTYTGASLMIESRGNIRTSAITINRPDTFLTSSDVGEPDFSTLTSGRALILRAGTDTFSGGISIPTPDFVGDVPQASVNYPTRSSAGNLTIDGNITSDFGGPLTVILEANGDIGSISTSDINSTVFSGDGGNISITANGDIATGSLTSFIDRNGQGNAGDIQITSNTGNITIGGSINSESSNGVAGDVTLTAAGDIRPGDIKASSNSSSGDQNNFNTIILNSLEGSVFLNGANLSTTNTGSDYAGIIDINGKDIQIISSKINNQGVDGLVFIGINDQNQVTADNVTIRNSDINTTRNIASNLPPTPKEGIQINSLGGIEIDNSTLTATTNSSAPPGSITLDATGSVDITNSSIRNIVSNNATVQPVDDTPTITLKGSSITVTNSELDASTSGEGDAGNLIINARDQVIFDNANAFATVEETGIGQGGYIDINTETGSLFVRNGAQLQALTQGRGNAGNVTINARDVSLDSSNVTPERNGTSVFTKVEGDFQTQGGQERQGGDITITTGSLSVTGGAQLIANTEGRGNAGNVTINADNVSFIGTSSNGQFPSAAFVRVNDNAVGNARNINITTGSLSVTDGAQLFAETLGQGNAGFIQINASNTVNISGSNQFTGQPSGLFTSTNRDSTGAGGNITVGNITRPNLFRISNGAVLFASTSNNQKAGDITINANRFEAIKGGQLIAETTSPGAAGTITVNADRRMTVSGSDTTFTDRRSRLGNRRVENIETNSEVFSGLFVNSETITPRAGDIRVSSPIVFLDDRGRLTADSSGGNGGDITLKDGTLLLLRRNSLISTNAGRLRPGNGGNIFIDYPDGFIIAGFNRNNDIKANAFGGSGGKVTINALGVVNMEALSRDDLVRRLRTDNPDQLDSDGLATNDITAISQLNPDLSGAVVVNAPNVDPTRGTIQLPEDLGDSSRLIAQSCRVGVQGAASSFVLTGRGGLPPNPGSALSTDTFLGSAANADYGENATPTTSVAPREAQGIKIGPRGEIILTARPSTLTPYTLWQTSAGCNGQ